MTCVIVGKGAPDVRLVPRFQSRQRLAREIFDEKHREEEIILQPDLIGREQAASGRESRDPSIRFKH